MNRDKRPKYKWWHEQAGRLWCVPLLIIVFVFVIIVGDLILGLFGIWTSESGNSSITISHAVAIVVFTGLLIILAWFQANEIRGSFDAAKETSKAEFLLHIDRGFRNKESIKARAIIHQFYTEENKKLSDSESIIKVAIRIKEMGDKSTMAESFTYLVNFLDFLETIAYICNKNYISSADVKELLGESIGYYHKVFKEWIRHRRRAYGNHKFYSELDKFIAKKEYEKSCNPED